MDFKKMIINLYLLIGINFFINSVVLSQPKIDSELILGIFKMLKSKTFNSIGITYGSKQLNDYVDNEWWMSNILKVSSSMGVSLQITKFCRISKIYSTIQIIFCDSLYTDEIILMLEKFRKDFSMLILLTRNDSDCIFELQRNYGSLVIIGRYSNEGADFSRLSLGSEENESVAVASWTAEKGFQGTLFQKDWAFPTGDSSPLSVMTLNDPPFIIIKFDLNGTEYAEGYLIDLWNIVTERLNLSYEIVFVPVEESWSGVQDGYEIEASKHHPDVILFPSVRWLEERQLYTGVYPGISLQLGLYQKRTHMSYLDFIKNINFTCFVAMTAIGIISLLLLYVRGNDLVESAFYILFISLNQSRATFPRSNSGRFAIISISFAVMIFSLTCIGSLTSLAVTRGDANPKPMKELLNPVNPTTIASYTSTNIILIYSSLWPYYTKVFQVYSEMEPIPVALKSIVDYDINIFIERERSFPYFHNYKCCVLETLVDTPKYRTYFFIRKNLTHRKSIDHEIKRLMETGILTHLKNKWWPGMDVDITENVFIPVTIADVSVIFITLFLGLLITLIIFCVERQTVIA